MICEGLLKGCTYSEKVSIFDGRTTQMDVEGGALPVSEYYDAKAGTSLANFGVSVGHSAASRG